MSEKSPRQNINTDLAEYVARKQKEALYDGVFGDSILENRDENLSVYSDDEKAEITANKQRFDEGNIYLNNLKKIEDMNEEERYTHNLQKADEARLLEDWDLAIAENETHEAAKADAEIVALQQRIENDENLSIANRAAEMAMHLQEKITHFDEQGEFEKLDAYNKRLENRKENIEKLEEKLESSLEIIDAQQEKDREANGDSNDDVFAHLVNKLHESNTLQSLEELDDEKSSTETPVDTPESGESNVESENKSLDHQSVDTHDESTTEKPEVKSEVAPIANQSMEDFSRMIHSIDGTPHTSSQEVVIEQQTPDVNDDKFMESKNPESETPSVDDPEFMKSNDPEDDDLR